MIAIVDLKDCRRKRNLSFFATFSNLAATTLVICSPQELEFDGDNLYFAGIQIDVVYKRLLVNEYLPIMEAEYPALLDACRAGAVCMVNNFQSNLSTKKPCLPC